MEMDNTRSREALGIEYSRPMNQTLEEMANSMIDYGMIEDRRPK